MKAGANESALNIPAGPPTVRQSETCKFISGSNDLISTSTPRADGSSNRQFMRSNEVRI